MAMSTTGLSIVVGVDDSQGARQAARWAGGVAARFGDSLHLVHVMRNVDEALLVMTAPQQADAGAYPTGSTGLRLLHRSAAPVVLCPASEVGDRSLRADDQARHRVQTGPC